MIQQKFRKIFLFLLCTLVGTSILVFNDLFVSFSKCDSSEFFELFSGTGSLFALLTCFSAPYYLLLIVTLIATIYLAISKKENNLIGFGSLITAGVSVLIILAMVSSILDSSGESGLVLAIAATFLLPAFCLSAIILIIGIFTPPYLQNKSKQ